MRVLFVSHAAFTAGAEQALAFFAGELRRLGHDAIASIPNAGPLAATLDAQKVPYFIAPYPWRLPGSGESPHQYLSERLDRAVSLSEYYRASGVDLVVVNTAVMPEAVLAASLAETPVVLHAHGLISRALLPDLNTDAWRAAEDVSVSFADHLTAPSPWTVDFFSFAHGIPAERTSVTPNVVSGLDDLRPAPPSDLIVSLGAIEHNKNQVMLLRALARLKQRGIQPPTSIVGDALPAYREKLEKMISRYGLAPAVGIHKRTSDPDALFRRAGIGVVTSRVESFSRVCVEAMAHARPVVATRCGGPESILEDGRTGFLVDVDDHEAMADRLEQLVRSPQLRERMGRAAREVAMARYSPSAVVPPYVSLLEQVARTGGPRSPDWPARRARALSLVHSGKALRVWTQPEAPAVTAAAAVKAGLLAPSEAPASALVEAAGSRGGGPAQTAAIQSLAVKIVDSERRRETGGSALHRSLRRYAARSRDHSDYIRGSWFAPWLDENEPGERIGLSPFLTKGAAFIYPLKLKQEGLFGIDIAPWLFMPAWAETPVASGEILSGTGMPLCEPQTLYADATTGTDSLRMRFPALQPGPSDVHLRITGLIGSDTFGLKFYERWKLQPYTRRLAGRRLLCSLIYER